MQQREKVVIPSAKLFLILSRDLYVSSARLAYLSAAAPALSHLKRVGLLQLLSAVTSRHRKRPGPVSGWRWPGLRRGRLTILTFGRRVKILNLAACDYLVVKHGMECHQITGLRRALPQFMWTPIFPATRHVEGYSGWSHTALIVGWGSWTHYSETYAFELHIFYATYACAQRWETPEGLNTLEPLVEERSGSIQYAMARSIDNTAERIEAMSIIHIR